MIIKQNELNKKNIGKIILFYGKNEGLKKEKINSLLSKENGSINLTFSEEEILNNKKILYDEILNKSLFDTFKNIIVNNTTDKIVNVVLELLEVEIKDAIVILNAGTLEKKSKLRNLFEKEKKTTCVAFYEDTWNDLQKILNDFIKQKKISISQSNINLLIDRCNFDRKNLLNELEKIELFSKNKTITSENLLKLTNLSENYSIKELVESFLSKNIKKIVKIFNENNFANEESIILIKTLQNKAKNLLKLCLEFENNKNIDLTISNAKPAIFWKEKDLIRLQLSKWKSKDIKLLIYRINDLELLIKKNINISVNISSNFMIQECI